MDFLDLLKRAKPSTEPLLSGEWATLVFRPDLGSQQEFIVGVAAAIDGDSEPHLKWLPSLSKLSHLYGDAITASDTRGLFDGAEIAIRASFRKRLHLLDSGSPHLRIVPCGFLATHDIADELTTLLKRQAGPIWGDVQQRDDPMDDDWAYATMLRTIKSLQGDRNPFIPGRSVVIGNKNLQIGLTNGESFGNIVSARYASFSTIQAHIHSSMLQVNIAHKLSNLQTQPALFVVLPDVTTSTEVVTTRKTLELLAEIESAGVNPFSAHDPAAVALKLQAWASGSE